MDQVIEQVISEVRKRHKRSLWGNVLLWLNEESSGDDEEEVWAATRRPTISKRRRGSTRPTSAWPTASRKPLTQQDPSSCDSDDQKASVLRRNLIANRVISV